MKFVAIADPHVRAIAGNQMASQAVSRETRTHWHWRIRTKDMPDERRSLRLNIKMMTGLDLVG
jgi:hypothetical protein